MWLDSYIVLHHYMVELILSMMNKPQSLCFINYTVSFVGTESLNLVWTSLIQCRPSYYFKMSKKGYHNDLHHLQAYTVYPSSTKILTFFQFMKLSMLCLHFIINSKSYCKSIIIPILSGPLVHL